MAGARFAVDWAGVSRPLETDFPHLTPRAASESKPKSTPEGERRIFFPCLTKVDSEQGGMAGRKRPLHHH
jgi:hypothetical protein